MPTALPFFGEVLSDMEAGSTLVVLARGLGMAGVLAQFVSRRVRPGRVILGLNITRDAAVHVVWPALRRAAVSAAAEHRELLLPRFVNADYSAPDRADVYRAGGFVIASATVLVHDLLLKTLPADCVDGVVVFSADRIKANSNVHFVLTLFRKQNPDAFIHAVSENAQGLCYGFHRVEKVMRVLHVKTLSNWPRFRSVVKESLAKRSPDVMDLSVRLSGGQERLLRALRDVARRILEDLRATARGLDFSEVFVKQAPGETGVRQLVANFDDVVRRQLSVSPGTRKVAGGEKVRTLVADITVIRGLLADAVDLNPVLFYQRVLTLRHANDKASYWLMRQEAQNMLRIARGRIYLRREAAPEKASSIGNKRRAEAMPDEGGKAYRTVPVLDENPKWAALSEVLKEIEADVKQIGPGRDLGRVVIAVRDQCTYDELRDVLRLGPRPYMKELFEVVIPNVANTIDWEDETLSRPGSKRRRQITMTQMVGPNGDEDDDNNCEGDSDDDSGHVSGDASDDAIAAASGCADGGDKNDENVKIGDGSVAEDEHIVLQVPARRPSIEDGPESAAVEVVEQASVPPASVDPMEKLRNLSGDIFQSRRKIREEKRAEKGRPRQTAHAKRRARATRLAERRAKKADEQAHAPEQDFAVPWPWPVRIRSSENVGSGEECHTLPGLLDFFGAASPKHPAKSIEVLLWCMEWLDVQGRSKNLLDEFKPSFVVMYNADVAFVRQVEVFRAESPGRPVRLYLLAYDDVVDETRYRNVIEREQDAFKNLIRERATMLLHDDDGEASDDNVDAEIDASDIANGGRALGADRDSRIALRNGPGTPQAGKGAVIVDTRELRSSLPMLLYMSGITILPVTLEVGDFVLSNTVAVERKSVSDLYGSFNSGRLFKQAEALCRHYKNACLLIELDAGAKLSLAATAGGVPSELVPQSIISKMVLLIQQFPALRLLWAAGAQEASELFKVLKAHDEEPSPEHAASLGVDTKEDGESEFNSGPVALLRSLPGIDGKNITAVMRKVRDVSTLLNMSVDELTEVLGSAGKAKRLYEFANEEPSEALASV